MAAARRRSHTAAGVDRGPCLGAGVLLGLASCDTLRLTIDRRHSPSGGGGGEISRAIVDSATPALFTACCSPPATLHALDLSCVVVIAKRRIAINLDSLYSDVTVVTALLSIGRSRRRPVNLILDHCLITAQSLAP